MGISKVSRRDGNSYCSRKGVVINDSLAIEKIADCAIPTRASGHGVRSPILQAAWNGGQLPISTGPDIAADVASRSVERYLAHAAAGCISSAASGGDCGSGAASAIFGKFAANNISFENAVANGIAATVAGGVGSVIAGGKFENGAATAAFGYLFNCGLSKCWKQYAANVGKVTAGGLGVAGGIGLCATGVGCIVGAPATVFNAATTAEGINGLIDLVTGVSDSGDGRNLLKESVKSGLGNLGLSRQAQDWSYSAMEVGSGLLALRAPVNLSELWVIRPHVSTLPGLPVKTIEWKATYRPAAVGGLLWDATDPARNPSK